MSTEQVYAENEVSTKLSKVDELELNKLANEDVNQLNNEETKSLEQESILNGRMRNDNPRGLMTLLHTKIWGGTFEYRPPSNFLGSSSATFKMTNKLNIGCKAAVVYVGRNQQNTQECGWLFAWLSSTVRDQWKVYAECGPRSRFNNPNWNLIEAQLDRSGSSISVSDGATNTRIFAQIVGVAGQSTATTAVVFN